MSTVGRGAARGFASDLDSLEPRLTPVHDEDAEALLHARLDVGSSRRISAGTLEFLARCEHLLYRVFVRDRVDNAFAGGVGGGEHAAQRPRSWPEHGDAFDGGDLTHVREAFLALDDRPIDQLSVR